MADDIWAEFRAQPTAASADPWAEFKAPQQPQRGVMDKLLGLTGPRYQTWPERTAREIASIPEKTISAAGSAPVGSRELTQNLVAPAAEAATVFSPMAPGVGAAIKAGTPSQEALFKTGGNQYNAARKMDVLVSPDAVKRFGGELEAKLNEKGVNDILAPKSFSVVKGLQNPNPESIGSTVSNFETARRTFQNAGKDRLNETEQLAAGISKNALDDFLASVRQPDLVSGDAAAASNVLSKARGNWSAGERSQDLTTSLEDAYFRSKAGNSGQNIGNTIRQEVNKIRSNEGRSAGYNPAEMAQAERVVEGTGVGNSARKVANVLGGGGGLGQLASIYAGATYGGAPGAILGPTIGALAKAIENASSKRQARILDDMLRSRSPLAESAAGNPDGGKIPASVLIRMLLSDRQHQ